MVLEKKRLKQSFLFNMLYLLTYLIQSKLVERSETIATYLYCQVQTPIILGIY